MALSTARIQSVRGRPPLLAAGIKSLIHSHSSLVRSLGYIFSFIYLFYTTNTYSTQPTRTFQTGSYDSTGERGRPSSPLRRIVHRPASVPCAFQVQLLPVVPS